MNREIKFRGKRIDNGEWVYGSYHFIKGSGAIRNRIIEHPYYEDIPVRFDYHMILEPRLPTDSGWDIDETYISSKVDPITIGQYTGIKDKNGKEIYEGDRVKTFRGSIYKCFYREETGCFEFENELTGSYCLFNQLIEPEIIS